MFNFRLRNGFEILVLAAMQVAWEGVTAYADPASFQSSIQGTPGVIGNNGAGGDGVWGEAKPNPGRGVVGISGAGTGVWGDTQTGRAVVGVTRTQGDAVWGQTKTGRGVVGISEGEGVGVWADTQTGRAIVGVVHGNGVAVWGETNSASDSAAAFKNSGGGDLIRAGEAMAFRVMNNGDVLVRGQRIGAAGPQGAKGDQGPPGPHGPAVHTSAVCQSPQIGNALCPCTGATVSRVGGDCTVTSDSGTCSATGVSGCCAVCVP
jgi:hypothetical protein